MDEDEGRMLPTLLLPVTLRKKPGSGFNLEEALCDGQGWGSARQPCGGYRRYVWIAKERMRLKNFGRTICVFEDVNLLDALHTCLHLSPCFTAAAQSGRNRAGQEHCQRPSVLEIGRYLENDFLACP